MNVAGGGGWDVFWWDGKRPGAKDLWSPL